MTEIPAAIAAFVAGRRIAVAGVSRSGNAPANAILRRLRESGHEAVPINPQASEVEGEVCYADLAAVPGALDGLLLAAPPAAAAALVRAALVRGVRQIWFHRSLGEGSVSEEAVRICRAAGVEPIVGGCPLMFLAPIDPFHRFLRWSLRLFRRLPN